MAGERDLLFRDFTTAQRQAFLSLGVAQVHPVQSVLLEETTTGSEMLFIDEGAVSVWVKNAKINELGPNSVVGVSALIEPHPRTARLVAETEVQTRRFGRSRVLQHLEQVSPALFHRFFVNAFEIHMNLIHQCEERIVALSRQLGGD